MLIPNSRLVTLIYTRSLYSRLFSSRQNACLSFANRQQAGEIARPHGFTLPTGGATHVFELVAILVALQLVGGRDRIWLPRRWLRMELGGPRRQRFLHALLRLIRGLERLSRPRLRFLFGHRITNVVFGLLVVGGAAAAFLAPPFSGLDTLPALGVVLLSLGVLLEDIAVAILGVLTGAAGIALEIVVGAAALHGLGALV